MKAWAGAALVALLALPQAWPEAHPPTGQQPRRPASYRPFTYPQSPETLWKTETATLVERARRVREELERTIARGPYAATPESIAGHRAPEWFLDAKFGMFVDWGPWSVAGWAPQAEKATYPDWYEKRLFEEFRDYHVKAWGADIGPDDLIRAARRPGLRRCRSRDARPRGRHALRRPLPEAPRRLQPLGLVLHPSRLGRMGAEA